MEISSKFIAYLAGANNFISNAEYQAGVGRSYFLKR